MSDRLWPLLVCAMVALASPKPLAASEFSVGVAAYNRGDYATALHEWTPLAERGDEKLQYIIGTMYLASLGVQRNDAVALGWFLKSATSKYAPAYLEIGAMYRSGTSATPRNQDEAVRWFRKAADSGNAAGQVLVGRYYEEALSTPLALQQAVAWYRKAAAQGDGAGEVRLGLMYQEGKGVPQDYAAAIEWFHKAAELPPVPPEGVSTPENEEERRRTTSAAQRQLGQLYLNGQGAAADSYAAARWFLKAALQGDSYAQNDLGALYQLGDGVPQDYVEAYRWYALAAAGRALPDDTVALPKFAWNRDNIAKRMTKAQLEEARQLVRDWRQPLPGLNLEK